jgi:simple sugar transport system ATP-binding protein
MTAPVLEAVGIRKSFGSVEALRGANFAVMPGEIVALMGDNGAGKSTLVKTLCGVHTPDAGELRLDGRPVVFSSPSDAQRAGIETVYQDLALAPELDSPGNLFLGRELRKPGLLGKLGVLDKAAMRRESHEALTRLSVQLKSEDAAIADLSGGQRQSVAVARAVNWAERLVLMDEPTAALGVVQTGAVLDLIRRVRDSGRSVVLISHNLPDVLAVSDRIEVLRLGRRVARFVTAQATSEEVVAAMTGALVHEEVGA